jgi:hypothetical protein
MLKIRKKRFKETGKVTDIYSYFKDDEESEYFKLHIGRNEYYIKTHQGQLEEYYVYEIEEEHFRFLSLREKFKLETEFKKQHSLFKEKEIYEKHTPMLPIMFYRAKLKANNIMPRSKTN